MSSSVTPTARSSARSRTRAASRSTEQRPPTGLPSGQLTALAAAALGGAGDLIGFLGGDGTVLYADRAVCSELRLLGRTAAELPDAAVAPGRIDETLERKTLDRELRYLIRSRFMEELTGIPSTDLLGVRAGERWLDVACGTGAIALRAARAGAAVTGLDLAPALIDTARRHAAEQGVAVELHVGDCEALPYPDASFDTVTSTFGVMFAPDHAAVARELARVVVPGGRIALATWDAERGIPELFRMMRDFQPPPPPGAGNPFDWGRPGHVRSLLEAAFELEFEVLDAPHVAESGEEIWELMSSSSPFVATPSGKSGSTSTRVTARPTG